MIPSISFVPQEQLEQFAYPIFIFVLGIVIDGYTTYALQMFHIKMFCKNMEEDFSEI